MMNEINDLNSKRLISQYDIDPELALKALNFKIKSEVRKNVSEILHSYFSSYLGDLNNIRERLSAIENQIVKLKRGKTSLLSLMRGAKEEVDEFADRIAAIIKEREKLAKRFEESESLENEKAEALADLFLSK